MRGPGSLLAELPMRCGEAWCSQAQLAQESSLYTCLQGLMLLLPPATWVALVA